MNNDNLIFWLALMFGLQASIVYCLRIIFIKLNKLVIQNERKRKNK